MSQFFSNLLHFLQDVWRECHPKKGRVTWPTARAVRTSTIVVIVSSILLSVYIALCDGLLRYLLVH
jgi:preprotein translocase SecE subunit